ncbi:MAG: phage integrase N-terminal SAM-like domain-containing protein [Melioribacteraceae bacterium]|nr:phage integrase N-terminal SAM-like domain-containing protein [Melioribacteraceae bacterium]
MAKIKKLDNSNYLVDVYDKAGKRIRKVFHKEVEAKRYGNMIEKDKYDHKLYKAGIQEEKISMRKAIDEFMEEKAHLQPKTIDKYKNQLHQLESFAYSEKISYVNEFTKTHADEFKRQLLAADPSPKTANDYLTTAKSFFREQALRDRILKSPFEHIKKVKVKNKTLIEREDDFYNEKEIKSFFSQEINPIYRKAFLGLYFTGCRFEELANLKWDTSIDWDSVRCS